MRIILTGGGTGGHLIPLIAVVQKIRAKVPDVEFIFLGPDGAMEKRLFEKEHIAIKKVFSGKMRRYFSPMNIIDACKVPIGIIQCLWLLVRWMPDAIFSKGGYASVPVVLVGWLYRIPILVHESDCVPGISNIVLGKFAERVAISYPDAEKNFPPSQVVLTGNPLREDIAKGDAIEARKKFSLTETKKIIFVYGGSQGSRTINNKILSILPKLLEKYQIIHQTGEKNLDEVERKAGELGIKPGREGYHTLAFIEEDLKNILAVSDLVISRAGANSIAEIAANGKPAILIPLEHSANDHQRMNAYSLAKIGAAVVLEESNLGENMLLSKIDEILGNSELRQKLSENIKVFYHPEAAEKIAEGVLAMIK
ncbi:MAG: undecaprenyldiphospho-muramoylpentapeptide beta-N-acetylglucosaminyltransferase [Candidatus Moranbacteria bacterium]|nr:undecaprenyldiphospho-muramoylpentapeptide beta-N-acetylglucosaminyltransferase [Candidatus Moranbacteria bacterium]